MHTRILCLVSLALAASAQPLSTRFADPPFDAGMKTYWIWFGAAVTREGLDRDLANMQRSHVSGTVLLPVYPLSDDDPARGIRNLPFLSREYLAVLGGAARRARELGMTFDLTIGTGWPYGGPWITPDLGARMLRIREAGEALKPGDEIVATFGRRRVVSTPTGMMVKRPSIGDEGLVLDHYNPKALARHLDAAGEKLWPAVKDAGIRSFWCDSLEVFQANWTPGFLDQFARLRGYDLKPHLDKLFGDPDEEARHLRRDFWMTLSQLGAENFLKPLQAWCRSKGVQAQVEAYGQPPVSLGGFRYVDLPVGEHYEWRMFNASRWASSGGRLFGKNLIGAEAWTWVGIPNRFADTLEHLKLASDMHFVSGVNSLMAVSYVNTPDSAGRPGWIGYWGPFISHTQTWWPYFPLFSRYVQRVSFLLRQGRPVADVALYLPSDDVFADTPASAALNLYFGVRDRMHGRRAPEFGLGGAIEGDTPVISSIIQAGYSFDGIDSATLPDARVENGRLRMGAGDYAVVVLPNLTGMPLADLEKLAAFVRSGGSVLATRRLPELSWGWKTRAAETPRFKQLVKEMFQPGYGKGRAALVPDDRGALIQALRACVPPDLALDPPDPAVAFVHRTLPGEDFYFMANLTTETRTLNPRFRAAGRAFELWDPMTGAITALRPGRLILDPYGSVIVRAGRATSAPMKSEPSWRVETPIAGWTLAAPGAAAQKLDRPGSWTELPGLRHFSGTATYSATVTLNAPARRYLLDLGEVREIAEVTVNGKPAGTAWMRPYRVELAGLLRPGENLIEVKVTNLWINAMLGRPKPDYSALKARFGARFPDPSEWKVGKVLPSGLLGPVRLMASE